MLTWNNNSFSCLFKRSLFHSFRLLFLYVFVFISILINSPLNGSTFALLSLWNYLNDEEEGVFALVCMILLNTARAFTDTSLCVLTVYNMLFNVLLMALSTFYIMDARAGKHAEIGKPVLIILTKTLLVFLIDLMQPHGIGFLMSSFLLFRPYAVEKRNEWSYFLNQWWVFMIPVLGLGLWEQRGAEIEQMIAMTVFISLSVLILGGWQYGIDWRANILIYPVVIAMITLIWLLY
jgi:hypothetical protein